MKILIADPHREVQSALRLIADRIPQVNGVSEAGSLVQLLAGCAQFCPDLILLDLGILQPARIQAQALADLMRVIQRLCPGSKVVVMSSRMDAQPEALAAGASGFISKTAAPDEVTASIVRYLENSGKEEIRTQGEF